MAKEKVNKPTRLEKFDAMLDSIGFSCKHASLVRGEGMDIECKYPHIICPFWYSKLSDLAADFGVTVQTLRKKRKSSNEFYFVKRVPIDESGRKKVPVWVAVTCDMARASA